MVRRHLRTSSHRPRRLAARRPRHSSRSQPARPPPHHRQPISNDLPSRRIPHQQDAPLLSLRKQPSGPRKSAYRPAHRSRIQCSVRPRENRIADIAQTKLKSRCTQTTSPVVSPDSSMKLKIRRINRFFNILLGALAMGVVALLSAYIAMRLAIHGREVKVPNLAGLSLADASKQTRSLGLRLTLENRFYSPN